MVRDEDDRMAFVAQRLHPRKKQRRLVLAEHGRRLVEDQDPRVAREALRDLDELRLRDRERRHRLAPGVKVRTRAAPEVRSRDRRWAERFTAMPSAPLGSRPSVTFSATSSVGTRLSS
jgi:hypothetical protein